MFVKGRAKYATDDALNAAECNSTSSPLFKMTGGYVDLAIPSGDTDTIDSNGNVTITSGVLIVKNGQTSYTSNTGGTIDLDGTLSVTGGVVISVGCWCSEASMSASTYSTSKTLSSSYTYTLNNSSATIASFTLKSTMYGYRIYIYGKSGTYTFKQGSTTIVSF